MVRDSWKLDLKATILLIGYSTITARTITYTNLYQTRSLRSSDRRFQCCTLWAWETYHCLAPDVKGLTFHHSSRGVWLSSLVFYNTEKASAMWKLSTRLTESFPKKLQLNHNISHLSCKYSTDQCLCIVAICFLFISFSKQDCSYDLHVFDNKKWKSCHQA